MGTQPISDFRKRFRIDSRADLRDVSVAVEAIYRSFAAASDHLHNIEPGSDSSLGFRVHTLVNLLGRNFEHAQAMLVSLATGSPASAEALGRIVVEGSVNLTYLAVMGNSATIIRFFRDWIQEHRRRLNAWKTEIQGRPYAPRVLPMIQQREELVDGMEAYVGAAETQVSATDPIGAAVWPKSLFDRFAAIGRQTDYYESYHRLSGASHITAEDTITWLISLEMPPDKRKRPAAAS